MLYPSKILVKLRNDSNLADEGSLNERVDILIGNDYYFSLLSTSNEELNENLFLTDSDFEWILIAKTTPEKVDQELSAFRIVFDLTYMTK